MPPVRGRAVGGANNIGTDQKVYLRVNVFCIFCMPKYYLSFGRINIPPSGEFN